MNCSCNGTPSSSFVATVATQTSTANSDDGSSDDAGRGDCDEAAGMRMTPRTEEKRCDDEATIAAKPIMKLMMMVMAVKELMSMMVMVMVMVMVITPASMTMGRVPIRRNDR